MKTYLQITTCLIVFFASQQICAQETKIAQVSLNGKSVQLLNSSNAFILGVGDVATTFSTFNGTNGSFLTSNGVSSGELRQRSSATGIYEGAYQRFTLLSTFDYGSYALSVPTTDTDADGMIDVFQYNQNGQFTATGSGLSTSTGLTFSISIAFNRPAGSTTGTYTATTQNALSEITTVNGAFNLSRVRTGTMTYTRGDGNNLEFTLPAVSGSTIGTGRTTYTTSDADRLNYAAFTLTDSTGQTFQVRAGTLARSGRIYRGDLTFVDGGPTTSWVDFADNRIVITDTNDVNGDGVPDLTDPFYGSAPTLTLQPRSQSATVGQSVVFSVSASNASAYQWTKNGANITGATTTSFTLTRVALADAGTYVVNVTNGSGNTQSTAAMLTVAQSPTAPVFTVQPTSLIASRGASIVLTADAGGVPAPTLQWRRGGVSIAGATGRSLLISSVGTTNIGVYTCIATNSVSSVSSSSATIAASDTTNAGRLTNLSIRTSAGLGAQTLITGFNVGGVGTSGGKPLLIRGVGPSLSQFSVPNILLDPSMTVYAGNTLFGSNDDWDGNAQVKSISAQVGAFPFSSDSSKDAAIFGASLPAGPYTAQILGTGTTPGIALAEIYDATPVSTFTQSTPRLINISARAEVGTNSGILIAGFVVGGTTAKTLLIRAVGPTLSVFGLTGILNDPKLELYAGTRLLNSSDDWANDSMIAGAGVSVGAFPLNSTSKDSALLVTLSPGSYTVQTSGVGNTIGVALVEIYDVQTSITPLIVPPKFEIALIPSGTFTMGDSLDGDTSARPLHTVTLPAFYLSKTETTWADWVSVREWAIAHGYPDLASVGAGKADNHPVQTVSWYDVVKWCNAKSEKEGLAPVYFTNNEQTAVYRSGLWDVTNSQVKWAGNGYRLPTEAEWEYGSRSGLNGRRFPWGDTVSHADANYSSSASWSYDISATRGNHPNYATGATPYTSPVGSFSANSYGLFDMAGNVAERCWDWNGPYTSEPVSAPRGPTSGTIRINRGGGVSGAAPTVRCADRIYDFRSPTYVSNALGFRQARSSVP